MSNKILLLTFFLLQGLLTAYSQTVHVNEDSPRILRIEPPNWWTNMQDSSLQIMIYGQNLNSANITLNHPYVRITTLDTVSNRNYLFINLHIPAQTTPTTLSFNLIENGNVFATFNFPLLAREPGSKEREGYSSKDAVYLITPDRFANGEIRNDNLPDMQDAIARDKPLGRHGGDIRGIIDHIDYIEQLGITSIWLNPILENRMDRHSYHGYAITDFYKVDPRFGTNQEYRDLSIQAEIKGIKLIKDMVLNHCGLNHWWMKDPPTQDWINYAGQPYKQTNHRKTLNSDPYAAAEDKEILMRGWFVPTMPDLNLQNRFLARYMIQNTVWWIEFAGLRGIRMDTYPYPDEEFMSEWAKHVMKEYPNFNITGEAWYEDPSIISYWQRGKTNQNGYSSDLPSLCDFPLQNALIRSLNSKGGYEDEWMPLYEMLAKDFNYPDPGNLVVFADNHDMSRLLTQVGGDMAKFKMALAYILTIRGIPQIYYGTETLMTNEGTDNHGVIRSDFPGGWVGDPINAFSGESTTSPQREAKEFLRNILEWRKTSGAVHSGKTIHFVPENEIYVYFRISEAQTVMTILNKNTLPVLLDLNRFHSVLPKDCNAMDVITGKEVHLSGTLNLSEAGPMILQVKH